jgi:hypothetical protein
MSSVKVRLENHPTSRCLPSEGDAPSLPWGIILQSSRENHCLDIHLLQQNTQPIVGKTERNSLAAGKCSNKIQSLRDEIRQVNVAQACTPTVDYFCANKMGRTVPWVCWEEWYCVRDWLLSQSREETARGIRRVSSSNQTFSLVAATAPLRQTVS